MNGKHAAPIVSREARVALGEAMAGFDVARLGAGGLLAARGWQPAPDTRWSALPS